jgi:CIC family chloride channel protein
MEGLAEPIGRLVRLLDRVQPGETTILVATALVVGVGAGFGAIIFRWLINGFTTLAFDGGRVVLGFLGQYYVVLIPALGGLIVGPMIYFFAREAKGHGVPEVMEAVALRGGRIRPIVVVIKALASSVCIGSGGSVGREGPIVQIGSALGSTIGQWLKLSDARIRNLVACGAAGGIAATFNAPIAGVLFALEIILGEFGVTHFSTVVIASVTASVVSRIFLGDMPAFIVPPYSLVSPWELLFYAIMGVLAAPLAILFIRVLYGLEDLFEAVTGIPEYIKPAIGGLLIGAIGLFFPQIFGVGYETIEAALRNELVVATLGTLLVVKVIATSLTIGSGGSGGVFAPSLFMGAMMGGVFGHLVHTWFPTITAAPGAYALVGMAAFFSAAARAPITAIIILFEMTGDYRIILPLMLATVVSTLLAEHLHRESIYTMKLSRRGVRLERGLDVDVMQGVTVGEVMTQDVDTVPATLSLRELAAEFERTHHHGFPVLDEEGKLFGIVSLQDMQRALQRKDWRQLTVADIATRDPVTVYPNDPMWVALRKMAPRDLSRLPVVDPDDPKKLLGVLRRPDLVRAYNVAIMRRMDHQHRLERLRLGRLTDTQFVEFDLPETSPAVGKRLCELPLGSDCLVVSIRRDRQVLVAHGDTVLEPGDHITVFTKRRGRDAVCKAFGVQL